MLGGFLATHQLQQLFVAPRRVAAASLLLGMQWTPPASADEIDDEVAEYIKMMRSESVHSFSRLGISSSLSSMFFAIPVFLEMIQCFLRL